MKILQHLLISIIFCCLNIPFYAGADSFKVIPARIYLNAQKKTESFRFINNTPAKASFQINAVKWYQDEKGQDRYSPTKDIAFFPKIFTLKSSEERLIRVGYQDQEPVTIENAYRLFVRELPVSQNEQSALKMLVNIGVPLFVTPDEKLEKVLIDSIETADGNLMVKMKNSGNTHVMINTLHVTGADAAGKEIFTQTNNGWYVLSGSSRYFSFAISSEDCRRCDLFRVIAEIGKTETKAVLNAQKGRCAW